MKIAWEETAWEDYLYWQRQDKKTLKRTFLGCSLCTVPSAYL